MTYNDYDHFVELEEEKPWTSPKRPSSYSLQKSLVIRIPLRPMPSTLPCPTFDFSFEHIHYAVVLLTCVCLLSLPFVALVR